MEQRIREELSKLYLSKILKVNDFQDEIDEFIRDTLKEEERFITFREFSSIIAGGRENIKTIENYPNIHNIALLDQVLPLYTIQTPQIDAPVALNHLTNCAEEKVSFLGVIFLTKDYELILLKSFLYENEMLYFTVNLKTVHFRTKKATKERIDSAKADFFMNVLPELLLFVQELDLMYVIKNNIYEQSVKYFIQYSKDSDLSNIRHGLLSKNDHYGNIEIEPDLNRKNIFVIKYGGKEKVIKFVESGLEQIEQKYRTRHSPLKKEDGIQAIIIKAFEPNSSRHHYVYVSNIDKEIEVSEKSRLNISALFSKSRKGFKLVTKPPRDSLLIYSDIDKTEL